MASSGRLRDAPEGCFSNRSASTRQGKSRGKANLTMEADDPINAIRQFLDSKPKVEEISCVLDQYQAFVIELARLACDTRPVELTWKSNLSIEAKQRAKQKFKDLKAEQPRILCTLEAYRDSVSSLQRILTQHRAKQEKTVPSVTQIVASNLGMLFGEACDTNSQLQGRQPTPGNQFPPPEYNPSVSSSMSSMSHTGGQPALAYNIESREGREARRLAREMERKQKEQSKTEMAKEPALPEPERVSSAWLPPAMGLPGQAGSSSGSGPSNSESALGQRSGESGGSRQSSPMAASALNVNRSARSREEGFNANYSRTLSQPSSPGRRRESVASPRTRSSPASPRQETSNSQKSGSSKTFSSSTGTSSSRKPAPLNRAAVQKTSTRQLQQAAIRNETDITQPLITDTPSAPSILKCSVAHKQSSKMMTVRKPISTYQVGPPQQTRSDTPCRPEQKLSFRFPESDSSTTTTSTDERTVYPCNIDVSNSAPSSGHSSPCTSPHRHVNCSPVATYRNNHRGGAASSSSECSPFAQINVVLSSSDTNKNIQCRSPHRHTQRHHSPPARHRDARSRQAGSGYPTCSPEVHNVGNPYARGCTDISPPHKLIPVRKVRSRSASPSHYRANCLLPPPPFSPPFSTVSTHIKSEDADYYRIVEENDRLCKVVAQKDCEMQRLLKESSGKYEQCTAQLKESNVKLSSKCKESRAIHDQLEKTKDQLMSCETRLVAAHNELSDCRQELEMARKNRRVEESNVTCELERLELQLAQANDKRRAVEGALANNESKLHMTEKAVQRLTAERDNLARENSRLSQEVREMRSEQSQQDTRFDDYEAKFRVFEQERQTMRSQCESLEEQLMAYARKEQRNNDCQATENRIAELEKQSGDLSNRLAEALERATEENLRAEKEAENAEGERVRAEEIKDRAAQERVLIDADRRRLEKFERANRELLTEKQKVDQTNVQLQEELKDLTEKYSSLEGDMSMMRKQINDVGMGLPDSVVDSDKSSSIASTPCSECALTNKVTVEDLKYILDTISERDSEKSGTSCLDCIRKDTEFKRLEERLTSLYKKGRSGKVSGQPAADECDFLRHENDRLNSALKSALEELKHVKQNVVEAGGREEELVSLRRENDRLNSELQKYVKEVNRLQSLHCDSAVSLGQPKVSGFHGTQAMLADQVQSLKKENSKLCCQLQELNQLRQRPSVDTAAQTTGECRPSATLVDHSLTNQVEFLRNENTSLNTQLKEAISELAQLKDTPKINPRSVSETQAKPCNKCETPLCNPSAPALCSPRGSTHSLTTQTCDKAVDCTQLLTKEAELESQVIRLEAQVAMLNAEVAELNQKLRDVTSKRSSEIGGLNRLIDDCADDKRRTAEKDKETINAKNLEIKRLNNELRKLQDTSIVSDYETCMEENNKLKQEAARLQNQFDLLQRSSEESKMNDADIVRLNTQITRLEEQLALLKQKDEQQDDVPKTADVKDMEIGRLKNELRLARKDIELYQMGQSPSGSTAYIVRMRDETITHLHEKIGDLERLNNQRDPYSPPRSRTTTPKKSLHRADKSEMLLIMTDETNRMKEKISKLENDNVKLIELIKQRDAKMFELKNEVDWLKRGTSQEQMITTYTQKLRQGEEEMGKLHQSMEMLTKKHSTLLLAKEHEILEVRTNYAKQLSQLINDFTYRNNFQEDELRRLCADIDVLEKRNFELERALRECDMMKSEQIPKMRADLETLRKARSELRAEFDRCNVQLKETQRTVGVLEKEKAERLKSQDVAITNKQEEVDMLQAQLELHESSKQSALKQKDVENQRLRSEINELTAQLQERDGLIAHWKLKNEDVNRQISDVEERHTLVIKAKNNEINALAQQVEGLSRQVETASSVNDAELFRLQSQLKELQRQHMDVLEQNHSTIKLKEDEMKRLYSEIGDMSAHLHAINKEKEAELQRLRNELSLLKEERKGILSDNQTMMEEKQTEIRKLMADMERMEVDSARMRATNEQAVSAVKTEYQQRMEQFTTDRAHLIAVKDNEIHNLRQEVDKLLNDAKDGGSSIAEMKKKIFQLEQDKAELLLLKEQWQADMDKLYSEYESCKSDKVDFERMVDRLSREMEERIEGLKVEHIEAINLKDNLIRELYTKVEKIAKDRGEMSAHLHQVLQQKELKIDELFQKIHEYDQCLDEAEHLFKTKLQKKSQEIKWLREEIRKMGEEGIRLLDMREREIGDMREHLKTMLKVMEHRAKAKSSTHTLIIRPQAMKHSEPHLKPATKSSKTATRKSSKTTKSTSNIQSPSKRRK